jgi:RNA-directed DNA polymerase
VEAIKYKANNLTTRSTTHLSLRTLLLQANSVLRGWATYFRYDASKRTLACVDYFAWWWVFRWLRKKHPKRTYRYLRNRYCGGRWWINDDGVELFRPAKVKVERYRYRGTRILLPWMESLELGIVGRFAKTDYDDISSAGALDESLAVP